MKSHTFISYSNHLRAMESHFCSWPTAVATLNSTKPSNCLPNSESKLVFTVGWIISSANWALTSEIIICDRFVASKCAWHTRPCSRLKLLKGTATKLFLLWANVVRSLNLSQWGENHRQTWCPSTKWIVKKKITTTVSFEKIRFYRCHYCARVTPRGL